MRVGAAFLQTFATQIIQSVASIGAAILVARGLGPTGQGGYAVFLAAVGLGVTIASVGQFEGNVLSAAGQLGSGRILLARSGVHVMVVALALVALVPLWRYVPVLGTERHLAALFAIVLLLEASAALLRGVNLGQHHILAYNLGNLTQRLVFLALIAALSVTGGMALNQVMESWMAGVAAAVLLGTIWVWLRSPRVAIDWQALRRGWGQSMARGVRALVTVTLGLLLVRCDIWMLGPMLGADAVGQMSVAATLAEYLWYVPSILGNVLFAAVAADGGTRSVVRIGRASRVVVALLGPAAMILALVGRDFVPWVYGQQYQPAGLLFVLLLPGMLALSVHLVVDSYFTGSGFPPISYLAAGGALVAKAGLNLIVVPRYGLPGAAVLTSCVFCGLLVTKIIAVSRATGVSAGTLLRPRWADVRTTATSVRTWLAARGLA